MRSFSGRSLRFGIICDRAVLESWQVRCVGTLLETGNALLALFVPGKSDLVSVPRTGPGQFLFKTYQKLFFRIREKRRVNIDGLFPGIPVLSNSRGWETQHSQLFTPESLEKIRGFELDFILYFGDEPLRGEILSASRYGVWSFHHDDDEKYRSPVPGFWEVYNNDYVTGAVLRRLSERRDEEVLLRRGFFKTVRHSYSKNLNQILSETSRWPAQVCVDIRNGKAGYLTLIPKEDSRPRLYTRPSNLQMCLYALKILRRRLEVAYRLLFRHTTWNIGIVKSPIHSFLDPGFKPVVQWFPRSKKRQVWADPFGRAKSGRVQVLFEKLDYSQQKGIICAAEIGQDGLPSQPKVAIELPVHMSYPYLFDYNGETYCIPETNQSRAVSVYKSEEFPYGWTRVADLLNNVRAIDTTIFQHNGKWWLTFTDRERGGDSNLYLWYAPDLWGPWTPHALNPVKTDIRSARPGGTPFEHMGQLYRPAQDCSRTGGGRIMINRVDRLTPTEFSEEAVAAIEPDPRGSYRAGLHTLSAVDGFTLIDGKQFRFVPSVLRSNIAKGFLRVTRRRSEQVSQDS